jgi:hypothetical protein
MHLPFGPLRLPFFRFLRSELVWKAKRAEALCKPEHGLRLYLATSRFGEGIGPGCLTEVAAFW